MKKIIYVLTCVLVLSVASVNAQITYEHTYIEPSSTIGSEFFLTNLGGNNYKYVIFNYDSARFSLYNLNHTPFLLNISIPISSKPSTNTYYRLGYITTTLFDCDSTNIEYAMMLNTPRPDEHPNFVVYRTDGTVLFSKDTVGTMFCIGCGSGSYEIHPIMNTPEGAKLYLFNAGATTSYDLHVFVYGLCGTLPQEITNVSQSDFYQFGSYVKTFPNPASHRISFEIVPPSNLEQYEFVIFNSQLQKIRTYAIQGETNIDFDSSFLSSGAYFYSLENKSKSFQTGKFLLSK